jgi:DnaJ-class molecular chaperone
VTPYAVLLVRPSDDDLTIRKRFHVLSRTEHPDRDGAGGAPGAQWYVLTAAYGAVKTLMLRRAWEASQKRLSGLCASCQGFGVTGSRVGRAVPRICGACGGLGRVVKRK